MEEIPMPLTDLGRWQERQRAPCQVRGAANGPLLAVFQREEEVSH